MSLLTSFALEISGYNNLMENMTLEQLLYTLPAFVYLNDNTRLWLHLQPTMAQRSWNAFYGTILPDGWQMHPLLMVEEPTPRDALISLGRVLQIGSWTLAPDPKGLVEGVDNKKKTC